MKHKRHQIDGWVHATAEDKYYKINKIVWRANYPQALYQLHLNGRSPTSWYDLDALRKYYKYIGKTVAMDILYGSNK